MSDTQERGSTQRDRPRKQQRISQACDLCHRRSIRCRPSTEDQERCQNCYDFDVPCTYERPSKRKKHPQAPPAPHQARNSTATNVTEPSASSSSRSSVPYGNVLSYPSSIHQAAGGHHQPTDRPAFASTGTSSEGHVPMRRDQEEHDITGDSGVGHDERSTELTTGLVGADKVSQKTAAGQFFGPRQDPVDQVPVSWKAFALACEPVIFELLDVFMLVIYPLYPLFDEKTLRRRVQDRDHLNDRGFFASVMGACSLASARVRDGALSGVSSNRLLSPQVSAEVFFSAAKDAISNDMTQNEGFEYMRACTLLSLTSIQLGHIASMQHYMGIFFTLAAMQRFYDEQYWGRNLSPIESELRRRIYWCTYNLDVYSATIWNCFLRSQEVHANVRYPSGDVDASNQQSNNNWVIGWNFSTDLYRVLEHTLSKVRARNIKHMDRRRVDTLISSDESPDDTTVMRTILGMYYELPAVFKQTPPMTGDNRRDIFAYQAANIQATLQLFRMTLFCMDDDNSVDSKCDVVTEVLSVFHTIPREYLRAISTPLIYHLGHIGQVLATVVEDALTQTRYMRVRTCVLSMADLLSGLEEGLSRVAGASQGLREQVQKLDAAIQHPNRKLPLPTPSGQDLLLNLVSGPSMVSSDTESYNLNDSYVGTDLQLPPELFGDWSWPPEMLPPQGPYFQ